MGDSPNRVFKLALVGDRRGLSCDPGGLMLGTIPLLKRKCGVESWRPRSVEVLNRDLSRLYGLPVDMASKIAGLGTVAAALNDNNLVKAKIAAVQLQLPDVPTQPVGKSGPEAVADLALRLYGSRLLSKTWDPDQHPRWPPGQSDGGQFRPIDAESAGSQDQPEPSEEIADDPAKFTQCNERCSKLLERYKTYSWSNVNEFHYRQCMNECMALG